MFGLKKKRPTSNAISRIEKRIEGIEDLLQEEVMQRAEFENMLVDRVEKLHTKVDTLSGRTGNLVRIGNEIVGERRNKPLVETIGSQINWQWSSK